MPTDPVHRLEYRTFLERLRAARKTAGLTQWDVARRLGKPQSYISKSESGERRLDVLEAGEMALLYGVALDDLVQGLLRDGS